MQGTVEVVSATGKGFRVVGQDKGAWYNKGKMLDDDAIASLKKGDAVEFSAPDGKWVTSIKKIDSVSEAGAVPQASESAKAVFAPKHEGQTEKSNSIARGCAANSVLGSPYISELLKGECEEETVQNVKNFMEKVAEFVYSGKF